MLPSGTLVAGGWAEIGSDFQFALAGYNADGSLDTTFGKDGKVVIPIAGGGTHDQAFTLLREPDGRLIAAGQSLNSTTGNFDYALARFDPDGNLDASFGNGGTVSTPIGLYDDSIEQLVRQSDGELIAAGWSNTGNRDSAVWDFSLAAYHPDGSLDSRFGNGGRVITPIGNTKDVGVSRVGLVQQFDGKLVVAGQSSDGQFELARYFPPDASDTPTPTYTPIPLPTPTLGPCVGDCGHEGRVTVADLVLGVSIALGSAPLDQCPAFDTNGDHLVSVSELIAAVNSALQGCLPVAP